MFKDNFVEFVLDDYLCTGPRGQTAILRLDCKFLSS